MKILLIILSIFKFSPVYAVECEWWQTKYSATTVNKYPKKGKIREHPRDGHCRDKWPKADFFIKTFKNKLETDLEFTETIKPWTRQESEEVLKTLSTIPEVFEMVNYHYYRSDKSDHPSNPASIYILPRSIILFDTFFKASNKDQILVHESGHYLYSKLPIQDKLEFLAASGWTKKIVNRTESYVPPIDLVQKDSSLSQDEDYANYLELYLSNKSALKSKNSKIYDLFEKRFKR